MTNTQHEPPQDSRNVIDVQRVLLADGWHTVEVGSFAIDGTWDTVTSMFAPHRWATVTEGRAVLIADDEDEGFKFVDEASGRKVCGPLTSIFALEYTWDVFPDDGTEMAHRNTQ